MLLCGFATIYSYVRRTGTFLILALVAAVVTVATWRLLTPREFTYRNKRLTVWLQELEYWGGDANHPAFVAFTQIGTNAIPPLLEIIRSPSTRFQKMILKVNRRQSFFELPDGKPWLRAGAASLALDADGTNARPALPTLTNLLFHTNAVAEALQSSIKPLNLP